MFSLLWEVIHSLSNRLSASDHSIVYCEQSCNFCLVFQPFFLVDWTYCFKLFTRLLWAIAQPLYSGLTVFQISSSLLQAVIESLLPYLKYLLIKINCICVQSLCLTCLYNFLDIKKKNHKLQIKIKFTGYQLGSSLKFIFQNVHFRMQRYYLFFKKIII